MAAAVFRARQENVSFKRLTERQTQPNKTPATGSIAAPSWAEGRGQIRPVVDPHAVSHDPSTSPPPSGNQQHVSQAVSCPAGWAEPSWPPSHLTSRTRPSAAVRHHHRYHVTGRSTPSPTGTHRPSASWYPPNKLPLLRPAVTSDTNSAATFTRQV